MPTYEYQCTGCGHRFDTIQTMTEKALTKCPRCGDEKLEKLISLSTFRLKGAGWYVTDFKDKKPVKPSLENSESKGEDAKEKTKKEDVKKEVNTESKDTTSSTTTKKADKAD